MEPPEDRAADGTAPEPDAPGTARGTDTAGAPDVSATPGSTEASGRPAEPAEAAESAESAESAGASGPGDEGAGPGGAGDPDGFGGISRLSLPSRLVLAVVVAAVAVGAVFHIGMVFLHVAPSNTLSQQHSEAVSDYIYPEFEQNWKLFAPNPVQENTDTQARAETRRPDGTLETTGWVDLTAMDIDKIRHDPLPSHTVQNELRRAWGFYTDTHDAQDHPIGLRGDLSQEYLLHIVGHRFGPRLNGGQVERVQVRVRTSPIGSPSWSGQKNDTRISYRVLPWWAVTAEDFT